MSHVKRICCLLPKCDSYSLAGGFVVAPFNGDIFLSIDVALWHCSVEKGRVGMGGRG